MEDERSEARREGLAEGQEKGRSIGLAEGLAEGSRQKAIETAKIMKNMNYPLEDIYTITGLSKEEVKNL